MKALILAAGYATRLYPLTKKYPKPLLPVANWPLIDYIIVKLDKITLVNEVFVITNHKFFDNFLEWREGRRDNVRVPIKVINDGTKTESDRLGAIGDICFALKSEKLRDDTIIVGGDNLFEEDLEGFTRFALSKSPQVTIGVYDLKVKSQAVKYGVVKLGKAHKIIDFAEKPKRPQSSLIATCLYYIAGEKLSCFQDYLKSSKNELDSAGSFIRWLSRKEEVYGFVFRKHWYDIGDPAVYKEAQELFGKNRDSYPIFLSGKAGSKK